MAHPRKITSKTKRCIGDYKEKEYTENLNPGGFAPPALKVNTK